MEIMIDNYHNHTLKIAKNRSTDWLCDICKSQYSAGSVIRYRCDECDFDLCEKCISKASSVFKPHFIFIFYMIVQVEIQIGIVIIVNPNIKHTK